MELLFLIVWLLLAIVVGHIAGEKGRSRIGFFLLALLLSPLIGFLAVIAIPKQEATAGRAAPLRGSDLIICHQCRKPRRADSIACPTCGAGQPDPHAGQKKCFACAEWILAEAKKCKHCGEMQPEAPASSIPGTVGAAMNWKKLDETERMLDQRNR